MAKLAHQNRTPKLKKNAKTIKVNRRLSIRTLDERTSVDKESVGQNFHESLKINKLKQKEIGMKICAEYMNIKRNLNLIKRLINLFSISEVSNKI